MIELETQAPEETIVAGNAYTYFQIAPRVEQVQTNILYKELPLGRFLFIICACLLPYEFYTSPFHNSLAWFARLLSWVLTAGMIWYAWMLLKRSERQMQEQMQLPQNLFAIDIHRQKLVLDMLGTDSKSAHTKIDIDQVEAFYTWYDGGSESSSGFIYALIQNGREVKVTSPFCSNARDVEEMALTLGVLCNKRVWRRRNEMFGRDSIFELIERQSESA